MSTQSIFTIESFQPKTNVNNKPYITALADGKPIGIWEPADVALVTQHGNGQYEGELERKGQYTNAKGLKWVETQGPKPSKAMRNESFRSPDQIIRTDALRLAIEALQKYEDFILTNPDHEKRLFALADAFASYIEGMF